MDKTRLLETLDALRAEVAQSAEVDPAMLTELRRLTDEIRQADEKQKPPAQIGSSAPAV